MVKMIIEENGERTKVCEGDFAFGIAARENPKSYEHKVCAVETASINMAAAASSYLIASVIQHLCENNKVSEMIMAAAIAHGVKEKLLESQEEKRGED